MEAIVVDVTNEIKRVGIEVDAIKRKLSRLKSEKDPENADSHLTAIAAIMQSIYNGYERILEMLVKAIDGDLPVARDYHSALLRRASAGVPDVRPPLISEKVFDILDDIRRYRHVFRKIYHYQLKPGRVQELADMGIRSYGIFKDDIERFLSGFDLGEKR